MVYIAQLLCPSRHCVLAAGAEYDEEQSADKLRDMLTSKFASMVNSGMLNPYCGICGSRQLDVEVRMTRFPTMAEAEEVLLRLQEEQRRVAELIRASKN